MFRQRGNRKADWTLAIRLSALWCVLAMPVYAQSDSQPSLPGNYFVHQCVHRSVAYIEKQLSDGLPVENSVRIEGDPVTQRIYVSGPARVQQMAKQLIAVADQPAFLPERNAGSANALRLVPPLAPGPRPRPLPPANRQPGPERPTARPTLVANTRRTVTLHTKHFEMVRRRTLVLLAPTSASKGVVAIQTKHDHLLLLTFDAQQTVVTIEGPQRSAGQLEALLRACQEELTAPGTVEVVKLPQRVRQSSRYPEQSSAPNRQPSAADNRNHTFGATVAPRGNGSRVALAQHAEESGEKQPTPAEDETRNASAALNNVELQTLEDLDVIILRGLDRDVKELAEIIRQLEMIRADAQPEIRIYKLQHASSQAIQAVIEEVQQDLVRGRQGRVVVAALNKPNELVLVGWGQALEVMVELIDKLDQPVAAQSQFSVFMLRHAAADEVENTLQNFFADREDSNVLAIADARVNALIVHAAPRDMSEVRQIINKLDVSRSQLVNQVRVFPIENALATDLATTIQQAIDAAAGEGDQAPSAVLELLAVDEAGAELIRSGMLQNVHVTPNAGNNTIIVSAPPETMDLLAALIEQLDSPGDDAQIKVFNIVNGDAASMVRTLNSLFATTGNAPGPRLSRSTDEPSLAPLRFSVDARSNSIVATGPEGDLRIVEALLLRLDEVDTSNRKNRVYQLKNSPAVDIALAITEFLRSEQFIKESSAEDQNVALQVEREVVVVPEPVSNKLIISATPRYFDEVIRLIEELDEAAPQVMIQLLIAEVVLGNTHEFGVELGIQDSVLFDRSLLGDLITTTNTSQNSTPAGIITATEEIIQSATNEPGFGFNSLGPLGNSGSNQSLSTTNSVATQGLSNFSLGRANTELGFGGFVFAASSQNISVLIRALQESRRLEILSRPQIRTLDNQSAFIQVGQRVPRIVGSTVNQNGQSNSVTLENVGLIIGVTPRISPDGMVVMEIDAEKSNLGPEQEGIPVAVSIDGTVIRSPRIDTTTAQATVAAASGETIVLGGLITKQTTEIARKVPLLGDVPLIKHLFRYDSLGTRRAELLIILTPHVIRNAQDSKRIKQTEIARMNWCAADVYELHGDIGYHFKDIHPLNDGGKVIYPDENPRGMPDIHSPGNSRASDPPTAPEPAPTHPGAGRTP